MLELLRNAPAHQWEIIMRGKRLHKFIIYVNNPGRFVYWGLSALILDHNWELGDWGWQVNVEGGQLWGPMRWEPALWVHTCGGQRYKYFSTTSLSDIFLFWRKVVNKKDFLVLPIFLLWTQDDEWLRSSNSWPWIFNILSDDAENIYGLISAPAVLECLAGDVIDKRTFVMLSHW